MQSVLSDIHYHSEEAAYAYVETRIWPDGPVCPHCGNVDADRIGKLQGKTTRIGLYKMLCLPPALQRQGRHGF